MSEPRKLTDDAIDAARDFISRGGPQSQLAAHLEIGTTTWYRWLAEGEAAHDDGIDSPQARLWQAVREAQAELQRRCVASILVAGYGIKDGKGDWRALAWLLERRFPADFGPPSQRVELDAKPPPAPPPDLEPPLTPEEFNRRMRAKLIELGMVPARADEEDG